MVDLEMLRLARELQGCEVRLDLLGHASERTERMRVELESRLGEMRRRLVELEAAAGWSGDDVPPA